MTIGYIMTRINLVPVDQLSNEWLIAEYRELPRIPNSIRSGRRNVNINNIPQKFVLNTGHETFFYNKLKFLENRHIDIILELYKRYGKYYGDPIDISDLPVELCNDYIPDQDALDWSITRLHDRWEDRKKEHYYYSEVIDEELLIAMIGEKPLTTSY